MSAPVLLVGVIKTFRTEVPGLSAELSLLKEHFQNVIVTATYLEVRFIVFLNFIKLNIVLGINK